MRTGPSQGAMNLVASDLFFGLGAVLLVVVAALSLGLRDMVARVAQEMTATPDQTRAAVVALGQVTGEALLLADATGLRHIQDGRETLIPLDDLWQSDLLAGWLAEAPLLVIAPSGQDTAFLTYSRAAALRPEPIPTLRLPQDCRQLIRAVDGFQCQP